MSVIDRTKRLFALSAPCALALLSATAIADAQQPAPEPTPTPVTETAGSPTPMDAQYDGKLHLTLAPYLWAPTINGNFQFSIPTFQHRPASIVAPSVSIAPVQYVSSLNAAAMFAFDARQGPILVFGDFIYTNASASATVNSVISGPLGKVHIPVSVTANSRLAMSIWEVAAGASIAHGHNADLNAFIGLRQFPLDLTLDYNTKIGERGIVAPSGTIASDNLSSDIILGLRGKAFFGGNHWFVPYYFDWGTVAGGVQNESWQGFTGGGYAFDHGQTLVLLYRSLNYNGLPPAANVQKLALYGPLLGYTFNL